MGSTIDRQRFEDGVEAASRRDTSGGGRGAAPELARTDPYSQLLAQLVLASVEDRELASVIESEAERITGYHRAALWLAQTTDAGLVLQRDTAEDQPRILVGRPDEELVSEITANASAESGLIRTLIRASFPSSHASARDLVVPLRIDAEWAGVILLAGSSKGGDPPPLEHFARQASAALLNQRSLKRSQRHESQLELLSRAFTELSSQFDLEELLLSTIVRAREVLHAPIGYVMLLDPSVQEIYMRASSGTSTDEFRRLRLAPGVGLGGSVLQARQPFFTRDYLADDRFDHVTDVDEAVFREGIKTIIGAPMFARDEFVGVLFVAHHMVREPGPDDVAVLTRLSQFAALAIETARLRDRDQAALRQLRGAMAVVSSQNDQLRWADEAQHRFTEALLDGEHVDGIMSAFAEMVSGFAMVLDSKNAVIARTGEPGAGIGNLLEISSTGVGLGKNAEVSRALREIARAEWSIARDVVGGCSLVAVPVVASGEMLGSLWVELEDARIDELRLVIEPAARAIALEIMRQRSVTEAELRQHREFLDELLADAPSRDVIEHRAASLGIDLQRPIRLCLIGSRESPTGSIETEGLRVELCEALRRQAWCKFAAERTGFVVAIVDGGSGSRDDLPALLQQVGGRAMRAVVSDQGVDIAGFTEVYGLAQRLLSVDGGGSGATVLDLCEARALALLAGQMNSPTFKTFVQSTLGPVLELDPAGRGDLIRTIEVYLASGGSPSRAAAGLNIHVNTLYYRIERVRNVLGPSFDSMPRSLDLHLACIAWRLMFSTPT